MIDFLICIFKSLRHDNLVNLIEVFRKNRRIFLVFEFIEQNLLEDIEKSSNGLGEQKTREVMFQVVRGIDFMHKNNYIHRFILFLILLFKRVYAKNAQYSNKNVQK